MKRGLRARLRVLAGDRCDYCRTPSAFDPLPFQVDHVIAQQHGGQTVLPNLAWSCLHCNKHKGPNMAGLDPVTGQLVPLFHPRRQRWKRHFRRVGPLLEGRTRSGRATARLLGVNHPNLVAFRAELIDEGVFEAT